MNNICNNLNIRTTKISELASYSSLKSADIIHIVQKSGSNFYSRKTTFSDFVNSITNLTASLSGNVKGEFTGSFIGTVTGNLIGNLSGSFEGNIINSYESKNGINASIKGIPFTTLNGKNVSFEGTASYSVSSSYALNAIYANKSLNSNYSLSSSYANKYYSYYSNSSSYSLTSSFANSSSFAINSISSSRSKNSKFSKYTFDAKEALSSSFSHFSQESFSSSYAESASFARTSSFSVNVLSSSYALNSGYIKYPSLEFGMVFLTTVDLLEDTTPEATVYNILAAPAGTYGWTKVSVSGAYQPRCGPNDDGKVPSDTKYIYLAIISRTVGDGSRYKIAICPDINDATQPRFLIEHLYGKLSSDGDLGYLEHVTKAIIPVKQGVDGGPVSFYYKTYAFNQSSFSKFILQGYMPTKLRDCSG